MTVCWNTIKEEASVHLSNLIKINTSNPPGNEMFAIQYIKKVAEENGLYTEIQKTSDQRGNIIVSMEQRYERPVILLSHVDVVPANEMDWDIPPFSGAVIEDTLWGRGTIDTKQLTIIHLMTLILLKRNHIKLQQNIIMVATSDEENGSRFGLLPFLKSYGDLFTNSIVFNEGGGFPVVINDKNYYLAEMGQKGVARIKLTVPAKPNENPYMPNNTAVETMAEVIGRFKSPGLAEPIPKISESLIKKIADDLGQDFDKEQINAFLDSIPHHLVNMFKAMTKTTFSVTKWSGGRKHPTLNGDTEVFVDCRTLPHVDYETLKNYIEETVNGLAVQFEVYEFSQGYETQIEDSMLKLFEQQLQNEVGGAVVVPFLSIGSSDGRHLRSFNSYVYGYCPMLPDMPFDKVIKMVHGVNERIPLESLRFGLENMYNILLSIGRDEVKNEIK